MKIRALSFVALLFIAALPLSADEISPAGKKLAAFLDSMNVEQCWLAGVHVDWKTGEPDGKPVSATGHHTHCSAFAAAACERLHIYLLRPPEHGQLLLANAQYDWLSAKGTSEGWSPVKTQIEAQRFANRGKIVVAVLKNSDNKLPGHIAIVRPADKSEALIKTEGPEVTQAGLHNHNSATLKEGFSAHPGAFEKNEIIFFEHAVEKLP
jgi:hypothetical protein